MYHLFRLFVCLLLSVLIVSCATTDKQAETDGRIEEAGSYKYAAWRPDNSSGFDAIKALLAEADMLIEKQAFDGAADKLERALRIKPEYAPAWSRLSWLALQMNSPKRSVQMAKRSNSYASSDIELQSLNWLFISTASKALNDEDAFLRANQKIESLKAF